jgi:alkaline phosphatase D
MMSHSKTQPSAIDRRRFLHHTWYGVGASLSLALLPGHTLFGSPRFGGTPFTLGVASGDPTSDGIVLWTRLAPDPVDPSSLRGRSIPVRWRVALDAMMRHEVASGVAVASAALAHSVHVEVNGLYPRRDYFYQFDVRGEESPIGHFRTAPHAHDRPQEVRFAFVTCQDWPSGYYTAYRDMLQNDLDLVLHLGDYTYEYAIGQTTGRGIPPPAGFERETVDLLTYRLRHTLYKLDPDLQAAHARYPFVVIWDDHEVANDYSGLSPEGGSPSAAFTARRAAAYQAYYEHMPIRLTAAQRPKNGLRIYRRLTYGQLIEFNMLDDRQYRTDNPCGDGESLRCEEARTGEYTMLGETQERWLARGLEQSSARWNVIAQQLLIAQLEHATIQPGWFWNDAWDGYPLARQRMLAGLVESDVRNPVFITGDLAFDVCQRSEARFPGSLVGDRRDRVRDAGNHDRRRRHALRALLRADDSLQPAHQVLRRRSARLFQGLGDAKPDAPGLTVHHERRKRERDGLHREFVGRGGWSAWRRGGLSGACVATNRGSIGTAGRRSSVPRPSILDALSASA